MREADIPLEEGHNADMEIDKGSMDEDLGFPDGIVTFGQVGNQKAAVVAGGFLCLFCSSGEWRYLKRPDFIRLPQRSWRIPDLLYDRQVKGLHPVSDWMDRLLSSVFMNLGVLSAVSKS